MTTPQTPQLSGPRSLRSRTKELRHIKASDLLANPKNWRRHPDEQRLALLGVIQQIGFAGVAVARDTSRGLELLDGHLRRDIAADDDVEIPVVIVDLNDEEADLVLASFDPLGALATADGPAWVALLKEAMGRDGEVDALIERLGQQVPLLWADAGATSPDDAPAVPAEPVTKPGDLYTMGDHRLLCGDATKPEDVTFLLDRRTPTLMVTDPPYGVNYDPAWREKAAKNGKLAYAARRIGKVSNDDRADWSEAWTLFPGSVAYVWHAAREVAAVLASLNNEGFEDRCQIIWSKPHFPIGRGHYHWRHEPCWYAVRRGSKAWWIGNRKQTTIWEMALDPNVEGGHSTQKPIEAMERPIRNHEAPVVYDPFVGSGTTVIAAQRQHRACYAMEIDPGYCDVTVARWEAFTNEKAERHARA